mmetsp:Transcript_58852/g.137462  ORF Transcript_58852/g.137462 Transcript_58852/m.137462 type:complete len:424 (+) Transcript_58852:49-1320(+)
MAAVEMCSRRPRGHKGLAQAAVAGVCIGALHSQLRQPSSGPSSTAIGFVKTPSHASNAQKHHTAQVTTATSTASKVLDARILSNAATVGAGAALGAAALHPRRKVQSRATSGPDTLEKVEQVDDKMSTTEESSTATDIQTSGGAAVAAEPPRPWFRMWTRADFWHIHAVAGTVELAIGVVYLLELIAGDILRLNGMSWSSFVPMEAVYLSLALGAVNALSGLQPTLLPRPYDDFLQLLGLGEKGNLKSGGFVNTAVFYFILAHQCVRVSPDFPVWLQAWDPVFASVALVGLFHAIGIIYAWVLRGQLSAGFAFGMASTLCLNLPVSLHLLLEGQSWVDKLSAAYPGWPEVFFSANYALAWAGAAVSLVLSLYERRVVDITERLLLTLFIGALVFGVIGLQAAVFVPEWFSEGQYMVMLTLIPP